MPLAYMSTANAVTLLQMDGILNSEEFEAAFDMAVRACQGIHEQQRTALKQRYLSIKEEVEEKNETEVEKEE